MDVDVLPEHGWRPAVVPDVRVGLGTAGSAEEEDVRAYHEYRVPACLMQRQPGIKAGTVYYLKYLLWLWMR